MSYSQIQKELGIHYSTYTKCINQGNSYLNFFKITDTLLEGAIKSNLNLTELVILIAEKQELNRTSNIKGKRYTKSKPITIKNVITGDTLDFPNILAVVSYLESINNKVNRNTITKYLNTEKPIKGYLFNETNNPKDKVSLKVEVYDSKNNFLELCDSLKATSEKYGVSATSLRLDNYRDNLFKGKYYFIKKNRFYYTMGIYYFFMR